MRDLSYLLSASGMAVIASAAVAWLACYYVPTRHLIDGNTRVRFGEFSAGLYLIGAAICAVAAIVAIAGWFQR